MRRAKIRFVLVIIVACFLTPINQMGEASPARQTGAPTLVLTHNQYVTEAAWSPDGRWILTETSYNTVHIWETQTGLMVTSLPHVSIWTLPSWSPDSSRLVTWVIKMFGYGRPGLGAYFSSFNILGQWSL